MKLAPRTRDAHERGAIRMAGVYMRGGGLARIGFRFGRMRCSGLGWVLAGKRPARLSSVGFEEKPTVGECRHANRLAGEG